MIVWHVFSAESERQMPAVRKLTTDEIEQITSKRKSQRKLVEETYDAILGDFEAGSYGEATLEPGENRLTVRNRLTAAAGRRGLAIDFRRTGGDLLRFKLVVHESAQAITPAPAPIAVPEPEPAPVPAKRKGGRPKKTA